MSTENICPSGIKSECFSQIIQVPFVYQAQASGIGVRDVHDVVWYRKTITDVLKPDKQYLLHFGAVDYQAVVYMNGQLVGMHEGGHTPFTLNITDHIIYGANQEIVVRVTDQHNDEEVPRGKQFWEKESRGIWYTNSTGIWQTVWLEEVPSVYVGRLDYHIEYDKGLVEIDAEIKDKLGRDHRIKYLVTYKDEVVAQGSQQLLGSRFRTTIDVIQGHIFATNFHDDGRSWTPDTPNLFDVQLSITHQDVFIDKVSSYFGFRKVHTQNGMVYLNNKPFYQKLILDQGYWPTGLLTAPSDDDYIKDIQLSKEMGFNGCRKHQKVEDPRFLYWADVLGFVVWGECAAPPMFSNRAMHRLVKEWEEIIERDCNHPSIITWVPINESWGVPLISIDRQQQHFSQTMYHYIHSLDSSRLVISNDGWSATETDIVAIHNYMHGESTESSKYNYYKETLASRDGLLYRPSTAWPIFAEGFSYTGQPILLTEFGGIAFADANQSGWGYTTVQSENEFVADYKRIMSAVYASEALWGYCYTQLTDVEQEINGLLTYDRKPKCDLNRIKEINEGYHVPNVR